MNQTEYANPQRGGIALRDYTQNGTAVLNQGGIINRLKNINFDNVARALVIPSLALGLVELIMPRRLQKWVGVRGNHTNLIRLMGAREIAHALLIFMQVRPHQGVWSRVIGDVLDLGLLGAAFTTRRPKKNRLAAATAFIAGTTALDVLTATQINRRGAEVQRISDITQQDLDHRMGGGAFRVTRTITINRPREELYRFWHNFTNLPQFMYHLEEVKMLDGRRSHWVAKAPAGTQVAWDAEMTEDRPNELIAWQSLPNAQIPNAGVVRFEPAAGNQGTVVRVEIEYHPPAGAIGKAIAMLFGEEPGQQVKGDLARFKQVMETGEVLLSDGSPRGMGQKLQHPAQPMRDKPRRPAMKGEKMSRDEFKQQQRERATSRNPIH